MKSIVSVRDLSKRYWVGKRPNNHPTLREALVNAPKSWFGHAKARKGRPLWALKSVSFEVEPGEIVGIIGRNGAGKSTLLKVLARIVKPSAGEVDIYGRVGSLLQVGTGFHPDLTGRENIFLNGAILGMRAFEIKKRFEEIVDFSEVGSFLETPVKYYSSGMYLRLAFSIAAHFEPEVLLFDEVLAVGDESFQRKCVAKIKDVSRDGRTIFWVSHNMSAIERHCGRVLLIRSGELYDREEPMAAITRHMLDMSVSTEQTGSSSGLQSVV
jgi:lipopolysaccharide transport system ATP-binding protein